MPQEIPYDLNFLPFAKLAIEDFYYCMYKEQHITKEQYQEIIFVLAEKQPVFYSRMSKPHFWSSEKKAAMLEMLMMSNRKIMIWFRSNIPMKINDRQKSSLFQ